MKSKSYFATIDFVCPNCGEDGYLITSEQVIETWSISHTLVGETPAKLEFDGGYDPEYTGKIYGVRCAMCGYAIGNNEEEACRWLLKYSAVRKDKDD